MLFEWKYAYFEYNLRIHLNDFIYDTEMFFISEIKSKIQREHLQKHFNESEIPYSGFNKYVNSKIISSVR